MYNYYVHGRNLEDEIKELDLIRNQIQLKGNLKFSYPIVKKKETDCQ